MNRLARLTTIVTLLLPLVVFGQAKVGTAGLQFLKVGVGARAVGIGAFTAVADDASALYYNPGGLIQLKMSEAAFSYINYPADLTFVFIGGLMPVPQTSGVFGVQVTSLFSDEMDETTIEMPKGTGRTFTASDLSAGISYSQRLTQNFSVGGTLKLLNEQLADKSTLGWGADVGTFYTTGWKRINIGMVIQNFGPDMDYENSPFPLPMTFKFGSSMIAMDNGPYKLLLSAEFVHPNDNLELYIFGGEFTYLGMLSLRMSKSSNAWKRDTYSAYLEDRELDPYVEFPVIDEEGKISLDGFSFGLGVKMPEHGVNMDYAWAGLGTLGVVHRVTLGYKLAGFFN